ncbi:MFS transporter [Clostridioides mangenotii]|uniref:MFS transporter n=1 Tax=Metaclostridioides mangenotii TaxID=1540 RepID=UPI001C101C99|nr:MFS transporter [Clostridioides mangenotii]MBU5308269.1 MFS transporter [Clostridioides mangenotii]MCR1954908.1 MFS transporter [Clostridioides mangenotii]
MSKESGIIQNESKVSSYRWVVWGILVVIYLTVFFHRMSVGVIVGDLEKSFGMNATQIANLGAMYFYAYTLMQVPTGILVDYLGPKKTVIAGSVIAAVGSILFSFASTIMLAYFSRLLVGLGVSVVFLSILKIQANWFPAKDFATMSGVTSFIGSLGGLLAQTPLLIIVGLIGWRASFLSMGVISLGLAVLVMLFIKNTPTEKGLPEVNPVQAAPSGESDGVVKQLFAIVKNPKIWFPAFAFGTINGSTLLFSGTFGVPYLIAEYGLSKTSAANIIAIALLASGIACVFVGKISDTMRNRKLPMLGLSIIGIVGWSLIVFAKPPIWLVTVAAAMIGISGSIGVICWSLGKEVSNPKLAGMSMSIVNVCGFFFAAILPVICGKFIDANVAAGLALAVSYKKAFIVPVIAVASSIVFSLLATETKAQNIYKG